MARRKRSYDDKFRASAVLMAESEGNTQRVADHLGMPESTLRSWINAKNDAGMPQGKHPSVEIYDEKKASLATLLDKSIRDAIGHLPDKWSEATAREIATAIGIFYDKLQLAHDRPTAIVKLKEALEEGKITPAQVKARWPNLVEQLYDEAGVNVRGQ